jgi:ArsR family transcriptional regulator, arsenate/arsenite/antimonite-responsive transcriptional repressor
MLETVAKAIASQRRMRILKLLQPDGLCVCDIAAALDLAPATTSKHIASLHIAGWLQQRRNDK